METVKLVDFLSDAHEIDVVIDVHGLFFAVRDSFGKGQRVEFAKLKESIEEAAPNLASLSFRACAPAIQEAAAFRTYLKRIGFKVFAREGTRQHLQLDIVAELAESLGSKPDALIFVGDGSLLRHVSRFMDMTKIGVLFPSESVSKYAVVKSGVEILEFPNEVVQAESEG